MINEGIAHIRWIGMSSNVDRKTTGTPQSEITLCVSSMRIIEGFVENNKKSSASL
jgi:hypothetical protein